MRRVNTAFFYMVVFLFSACLLVLSLLIRIDLSALRDEHQRCREQLYELQEENRLLRLQWENSISLEELERYAIEELGMQHCSPSQIEIIKWEDSGVKDVIHGSAAE